MKIQWVAGVVALYLAGFAICVAAEEDSACGALAAFDFREAVGATVDLREIGIAGLERDLPEYCQVVGNIAPEVGFELRMPTEDLNGKLLVSGCGGLCGVLMTAGMEDALIRGYATVTTDMGHSDEVYPDTRWAYRNKALEIDFSHRATHVTTLAGKAIIRAYYGASPVHSYFRGCSTGGRQALVAAQRYPRDFDGIIAGAPFNQAYSIPHFFWAVESNTDEAGNPILAGPQFNLLHGGALSACDADDGLVDAIISDPEICSFDPEVLRCEANDVTDCLTAVQVEAAEKIYQGARNSRGEPLYPSGPAPGSEFTWKDQLVGKNGQASFFYSVAQNWLQYLAYEPDPPFGSGPFVFDYDEGPELISYSVELIGFVPQLARFNARGGKLLMFHGWVDQSFPGSHTIDYWQQAVSAIGDSDQLEDFFRLFMVPGMTHCGGGPGASDIDYLTALEQWVEIDEPPDVLLAHKRADSVISFARQPRFPLDEEEIVFSRPVYPYPDVSHYAGEGNPAAAESFVRVKRDPQ